MEVKSTFVPFLLNKCHECMRIKMMRDEADQEKTPHALGKNIKRTITKRKMIISYVPGPKY